MTETEKKALALLNECAGTEVYGGWKTFDPNLTPCTRALCRAIEQHEAFRQEVSDAVTGFDEYGTEAAWEKLSRFIIAKPDPLVEVMNDFMSMDGGSLEECVEQLRAALAARGLEIREKQP